MHRLADEENMATPASGRNGPDPRLNAYRADLADARLRGVVAAARYVAGRAARVVAGIAPVRAGPGVRAEIVTHYHYGEPVTVFAEDGGYAWCQSLLDSYVGYVAASELRIAPAPPPTHFVATMGCFAYEAADLRSNPIDFLPRHAAVVAETGLITRDTQYARLDTGGFLPLACLAREPPRSADMVGAATLYLGCPYLWGGRSWRGVDCSGLVQSAFRDMGVAVLRDTDMQRDTIGVAIAPDHPRELRRADLLFLPGHVLIHAGGGRVIHADGATMTVRRDRLAALMRSRRWTLSDFVVRRCVPPDAAGDQPGSAGPAGV